MHTGRFHKMCTYISLDTSEIKSPITSEINTLSTARMNVLDAGKMNVILLL